MKIILWLCMVLVNVFIYSSTTKLDPINIISFLFYQKSTQMKFSCGNDLSEIAIKTSIRTIYATVEYHDFSRLLNWVAHMKQGNKYGNCHVNATIYRSRHFQSTYLQDVGLFRCRILREKQTASSIAEK